MSILNVLVNDVIETVTLSLFRVPLKWSSKNFPSTCGDHFDSSSIVSRILVYFVCVIFIYLLYAKCLEGLLKRMELSEINRSHLVEASWNAGFYGASIVGCSLKFILDYKVQSVNQAYSLFKEKLLVNEILVSDDLTFFFVIFTAIHVHSVCLTWNKKGYDLEFFTRLCSFLYFSSTYSIKCVLQGILCMLIVNANALCADIARICCILGRNKSYQIYSMKYIGYLFFIFHCILWGTMFLYILPAHMLWNALNIQVSAANITAVLLLNLSLWSFFWLHICSAPLPKIVCNMVWGYMSSRDLLDSALFPVHNEMLRELRLIRSRIQQLQRRREWRTRTQFRRDSGTHQRTIYQTVKCVIALKRRLKQNRERKAQILTEEQ